MKWLRCLFWDRGDREHARRAFERSRQGWDEVREVADPLFEDLRVNHIAPRMEAALRAGRERRV